MSIRTKNSAINLNVQNSGDGFAFQGGASGRSLTVQSGDVDLFGGGTILDGQILIGNASLNSFDAGDIYGYSGIYITSGAGRLGIGINPNLIPTGGPYKLELSFAIDSPTTVATTGAGKIGFVMPHDMNLTGLILSVSHIYPAPNGLFTVDLKTGYSPISILASPISLFSGQYNTLSGASNMIPFMTPCSVDITSVNLGTSPILYLLGMRY